MSKLQLTLACWDYDRTRPLIDGRVEPEGIDLSFVVARPRHVFPRMLHEQAFDVSELSLAFYVALKARGECPFVAIPVALSRIFRHNGIFVRTDAGIVEPRDLRGKRVGVAQYGSTAIVFMRGLLQDEYGVRPEDIHWHAGRLEREGHEALPPLVRLELPERVRLDFIPPEKSLVEMLEAGELDALCAVHIPSSFRQGSPRIRRLFRDFKEVERRSYERTRIFPIMHTVVIRQAVHAQHPWVAASLYRAFCQARALAVDGLYDTDALRLALPWLIDHVEEYRRVLGDDWWPYGVEPNRPTLEALGRYMVEQGLAPRVVPVEELFAPTTCG
jgi:4,5-dihydroxyphthalate decarboxylase